MIRIASLVVVVALVSCALEPTRTVESTPSTPAFVETPGASPTPPGTCDYESVEARTREPGSVNPACEDACRVDACRGMAIQAQLGRAQGAAYMVAGEEIEVEELYPWLVAYCDQTVDSCMMVDEVLNGKLDDPRVLDMLRAKEFSTAVVAEPRSFAELESDCRNDDAAACYALVDLDVVLFGCEPEQQAIREISLRWWQRACELEPIVYCDALEEAIYEWVNISCG